MFKETIEFDVPEYHCLKEHFKAKAEITENGNVVQVGDLTAKNRKIGMWAEIKCFTEHDLGRIWSVSSTNKTDELHSQVVRDTERNDLVDIMADHEARKRISDSEKEQALADALEKKVREIRAKGASLG